MESDSAIVLAFLRACQCAITLLNAARTIQRVVVYAYALTPESINVC